MRHVMFRLVALASAVGVPAAHAHVLAIAGAAGFEDQPFISLVQQLAASERAIYQNERPAGCTIFFESPTTGADVMKGPGYTILIAPTGPFGAMAPDWPSARTRLESEISAFQSYQQIVDTPCKCREYLQIVGFSDGASTIGGWLNFGALFTQPGDDFYGVIALIDVIRKFNTSGPNTNTNATWQVNEMPLNRVVIEYTAFRNRSGGILNGCLLTGDWTGHRITTAPVPWSDGGFLNNNTCHTDFPNDSLVANGLFTRIESATMALLFSDTALGRCNCVIVDSCPDLDGDGDVDLDDYRIFEQNLSGPPSGRGVLPGDIDGDGDVDLTDFGQFERAFSGS